ncbi:MAG: HAD family phosphatase [Pedosphaera sp.]|nr:HAD family phosphatase [Pedosphaera sp.]MSU44061.1 HAD family phosphatase [Pedosphaera sp.]
MSHRLRLISTDFDGTLHSDTQMPAVPVALQERLGQLQAAGVHWVINTGRDLPSLMGGLARVSLLVRPDYVVTVEREIHQAHPTRQGVFVPHTAWNARCTAAHQQLFATIHARLPALREWICDQYEAGLYEDEFSPFCLTAKTNADADAIERETNARFADVPELSFVRNDVYGRLAHRDFNKGSALAEVARLCAVSQRECLAAGDHFNDLPMLEQRFAHWLVAPGNAIAEVKEQVRRQQGFVSTQPCGHGVLEGLDWALGAGA